MINFTQKLNHLTKYSDNAISDFLDKIEDIPSPLLPSIKYSVYAGGKRLRPILCLASCEIFDEKLDIALPFAVSLELLHTYSLIHDDLPCMDNDDFRRGRATNHIVFGEGMAVLAGDALLNLAYENLFEFCIKNPAFLPAAKIISACAGGRGMIAGQCMDISSENRSDCNEETLHYIHLHKTAKLLEASVLSGAIVGGADDKSLLLLKNYSYNLGLAYQICDDILDVTGNKELLGKNTQKDENKLTYPKMFGLQKSQMIAKEYTEKALECLNFFGERADFLKELTNYLLKRDK